MVDVVDSVAVRVCMFLRAMNEKNENSLRIMNLTMNVKQSDVTRTSGPEDQRSGDKIGVGVRCRASLVRTAASSRYSTLEHSYRTTSTRRTARQRRLYAAVSIRCRRGLDR